MSTPELDYWIVLFFALGAVSLYYARLQPFPEFGNRFGWCSIALGLIFLISRNAPRDTAILAPTVTAAIFGGLAVSYLALNQISGGEGIIVGLGEVMNQLPDKFDIILSSDHPAYKDLPGVWVLIGGLWIAHFAYWGFNQYIIQRTFAAKSLDEAQKGIAFAAFLKLIIPIFVVLPGIIAYVINLDPSTGELVKTLPEGFISQDGKILNDNAAPWLIKNYIPVGIKGLILAALAAAIVSSLASMLNSTSTIFTMDIYKEYINKNASDKILVKVGRIVVIISLLIAMLIAPAFGNLGQVFQAIQEYTGVVSPGILAVFIGFYLTNR